MSFPTPVEIPPDAGTGWLSVLIPAFNEEATIGQVLLRVSQLGPIVKEIVVVDDASTDGTAAAVAEAAAKLPHVRLLSHAKNQGKTAAIRTALREATGDVVIIQDADLEYDPAEIPSVVAPIVQGHADVVFGSRFLVRRAARVLYFYHFLANKVLTFLSDLLTNRNMTDIETCYKAMRAGVIKPLNLTSRGFGMEVEITAMVCKTHARTYEVPISYYGRSYEEGKKISTIDGVLAIYYILYYNLIARWGRAGRKYIREVNQYLQEQPRFVPRHAPSISHAASTHASNSTS